MRNISPWFFISNRRRLSFQAVKLATCTSYTSACEESLTVHKDEWDGQLSYSHMYIVMKQKHTQTLATQLDTALVLLQNFFVKRIELAELLGATKLRISCKARRPFCLLPRSSVWEHGGLHYTRQNLHTLAKTSKCVVGVVWSCTYVLGESGASGKWGPQGAEWRKSVQC